MNRLVHTLKVTRYNIKMAVRKHVSLPFWLTTDRFQLAAAVHCHFWDSPLWPVTAKIRDLLIGEYDEQHEDWFWREVDEWCSEHGRHWYGDV